MDHTVAHLWIIPCRYDDMRGYRIDLRGGAESDNESAYTLIEEEEREELNLVEEILPPEEGEEEIEIGDD